jgi:hypothetical protein
MINYGYFRHRFDAHTDPKLNELADEIGVVAYGYFYTLLELYGSKYADKNDDGFVQIHSRIIANTWRKRTDSCNKVMTKLQQSDLLVFTKCKNTYSISVPNFSKYYGSYKKTDRSNVANKRKENKIKVNNNILNKNLLAPDDLIQLWNTEMTQYGFDFCHGLGMGKYLQKFLESREFLKTIDEWKNLFAQCKNIDKLKGENNINWKMNLNWLVDYDNVLKILNGNFEQKSSWLDEWANEDN